MKVNPHKNKKIIVNKKKVIVSCGDQKGFGAPEEQE
jgi:hypothetical protein